MRVKAGKIVAVLLGSAWVDKGIGEGGGVGALEHLRVVLARRSKLHIGLFEIAESALNKAAIFLVMAQQVVPEGLPREHLGIAQHNHTVLGTSQGDVETARVVQEANALMLVAANTAHDDEVLLTTLEGVDRADLNLIVKLSAQGASSAHVIHDKDALAFIRGDDTDLIGSDSRAKEEGDNLLAHVGLLTVEEGGAT